ncbi:MAG: N-acetyl-gamma-glutamyl-phosphate reductase [Rhodanobacteraceae bacterium]
MKKTVGIVGARGYSGRELAGLITAHRYLELTFVTSRAHAGSPTMDSRTRAEDAHYENLDANDVAARGVDAVVLAQPNGASAAYVAALDRSAPDTVMVDLSADHRFDGDWYYGLPELTRNEYAGQRRISNPGCYATAMQLAIVPLRARLTQPPACFGVSGYSGAGATSCERNDAALLADNLMPYNLTDHPHQREVSERLGLAVEFMPHVASYFRGITLTANLHIDGAVNEDELRACYRDRYHGEALIRVDNRMPWISRVARQHHAQIGGFAVAEDGRRVVVVAALDNLLKGAATQALQNLNIAFGLPELEGIPVQTEQPQ